MSPALHAQQSLPCQGTPLGPGYYSPNFDVMEARREDLLMSGLQMHVVRAHKLLNVKLFVQNKVFKRSALE